MSEKRRPLSKGLRQAIWNQYIGRDKGESPCWIGCGADITQANFECGHVISVANGGSNHRDNLRPICGACNKAMSTTHMFEWMTNHGFVSPYTKDTQYEIQDQFALLHEMSEWSHMIHLGRMICGIRIGIIMQWITIFPHETSSHETSSCDIQPSDAGVIRLSYVVSTGGLHITSQNDDDMWKRFCMMVHDGTLRSDYIIVFDVHATLK